MGSEGCCAITGITINPLTYRQIKWHIPLIIATSCLLLFAIFGEPGTPANTYRTKTALAETDPQTSRSSARERAHQLQPVSYFSFSYAVNCIRPLTLAVISPDAVRLPGNRYLGGCVHGQGQKGGPGRNPDSDLRIGPLL